LYKFRSRVLGGKDSKNKRHDDIASFIVILFVILHINKNRREWRGKSAVKISILECMNKVTITIIFTIRRIDIVRRKKLRR
jgi:hypothetical protein